MCRFGGFVSENVYGHYARLEWIASKIPRSARVLEFGCGTGCMLTLPLLAAGFDIYGVDRDERSIRYGQRALEANGLPSSRLFCELDEKTDDVYDAVIVSEVLEHVPDEEMANVMESIRGLLRQGGTLIVTVPNGFGWFELESFFWSRLRIGKVLEGLKIAGAIQRAKRLMIGRFQESDYLSTFDASPHLQRFTRKSIRSLLVRYGFVPEENSITGTVVMAGPFSNLIFGGVDRLMKFNVSMGRRFPAVASGFMLTATRDN